MIFSYLLNRKHNRSVRRLRASVDFRLQTNMNIRKFHENRYISPKTYTVFKLTNLRLFMIVIGVLTIFLSFFGTFSSPYLETIGYGKESDNIIKFLLFLFGLFFCIIGLFLFEYVQTQWWLYIPLSIINLLIGIVVSQISFALLSGKDALISNDYISIPNSDIFINSANYLKNNTGLSSFIGISNSEKKRLELELLSKELSELTKRQEEELLKLELLKQNLAAQQKALVISSSDNKYLLYTAIGIIVISSIAFGLWYWSVIPALKGWIFKVNETANASAQVSQSLLDGQKVLGREIDCINKTIEKVETNLSNDISNIKSNLKVLDEKTYSILSKHAEILDNQAAINNNTEISFNAMRNSINTNNQLIDTVLESHNQAIRKILVEVGVKTAELDTIRQAIDILSQKILVLQQTMPPTTAADIVTASSFLFCCYVSKHKLLKGDRLFWSMNGAIVAWDSNFSSGFMSNSNGGDEDDPSEDKKITPFRSHMVDAPDPDLIYEKELWLALSRQSARSKEVYNMLNEQINQLEQVGWNIGNSGQLPSFLAENIVLTDFNRNFIKTFAEASSNPSVLGRLTNENLFLNNGQAQGQLSSHYKERGSIEAQVGEITEPHLNNLNDIVHQLEQSTSNLNNSLNSSLASSLINWMLNHPTLSFAIVGTIGIGAAILWTSNRNSNNITVNATPSLPASNPVLPFNTTVINNIVNTPTPAHSSQEAEDFLRVIRRALFYFMRR